MTNSKNFKQTSSNNGERWKIATWVAGAVLVTLLAVWILGLDKAFNQPAQPPAVTATPEPTTVSEEAGEETYPQTPEEEYVYSHAYSMLSGIADQLVQKYGEEAMSGFELSVELSDTDYFGEQTEATVIASIVNLPADFNAEEVTETIKASFAEGTTWVLTPITELPAGAEPVANYSGFSLQDANEETRYGDYILYVDFFQPDEGGEWAVSLNSSMYGLLPEDLRNAVIEGQETETPTPTEESVEESGQ